ncbi:MAG: transglutaminase domain-containing protein [Chloroflexi bacterium]|nr:transglutaminase domain-containing protein [Chloroflexota bacterium]
MPHKGSAPLAQTVRRRETFVPLLLIGALAWLPAWSIELARWSDNLEPLPWAALGGVLAGWALARVPWAPIPAHILGLLGGASGLTLLYGRFLPTDSLVDGVHALLDRVGQWFGAAISGGASTDNLLFAYSTALLAWAWGYAGSFGGFRQMAGWWAIVPTGAVLLLNLSYSPPALRPIAYLQIVASLLSLLNLSGLRRLAEWRLQGVEPSLSRDAGFAMASGALVIALLFTGWSLPGNGETEILLGRGSTVEASRTVSGAWETVSGPWQDAQATFDRLFSSLKPSALSARGLTSMQTLAPRGSFELGEDPVYRVTGKQPAYWRAATYDRYTGQLMTGSKATSLRRDRRQPLPDAAETTQGRRFTEYVFTVLAPGSAVLHAPDSPVTTSVVAVYEYRNDPTDFSLLRPVVALRQSQQYSVLAAVPTASISELRRAGTLYPASVYPAYLQLPDGFPEAVRQHAWRVVGEAETVYDAAANLEAHLRTFAYKTRVAVPPPGRDWVSFILFDSKEGYCDYYATAMTVMLRSVGIPARVATGYVTGGFDEATQSYLVKENDAHTWTEVYFPGYGWITFEPSANRPLPFRPPIPLVADTEEELQKLLESEGVDDLALDEEEPLDESDFTTLPDANAAGPPIGAMIAVAALILVIVGLVLGPASWARQMRSLPGFARPYARVVRIAGWFGLGPRDSQTPYEYTTALADALPEAAEALRTVATGYVEGVYGRRTPDLTALERMRTAGSSAGTWIIRLVGIERWRRALGERLRTLVGERR